MYIPEWFREDDPAVLQTLIRQYSFAALVTAPAGAPPQASHLPFLLDAGRGALGTLRAHLARANPQWQSFADGGEALVIFQGPHAYVSPAWYASHPSVPTWNYAVLHCYGVPRVQDDEALLAILRDSVTFFESTREQPWTFDHLSDDTRRKMRGIVGFEIEITRWEGKVKMNQNMPPDERRRVRDALAETPDPLAQDVAEWMRRREP